MSISSQLPWPDVADPQLAGLAVEAPAPGIAQAERDRFPGRPACRCRSTLQSGLRGERIAARAGRDAVRRAARLRIDVDAQHLAEQVAAGSGALPVRIAAAAAVAEADVQEAVRAEIEVAAVVVVGRLGDRQQHALGSRVERLAAVGAREFRSDRAHVAADQLAEIEVDAAVRSRNPGGTPCRAGPPRRSMCTRARACPRSRPSSSASGSFSNARMRPPCSTTNQREASFGACFIATGDANVRFGNARGVAMPVAAAGRIRHRRRHVAVAAAATGGQRERDGGIEAACGDSWAHSLLVALLRTAQTARSFAAAASRVPSSLAKQNRTSRAAGGSSQNGDKGIAATPCRRVNSSQNAVSGRSGHRGIVGELEICPVRPAAARIASPRAAPRNGRGAPGRKAPCPVRESRLLAHEVRDRMLHRRRDRERQELVHLAEFRRERRRGDAVADLPAGGVVGLAEREHRERALAQPRVADARRRAAGRRRPAPRRPRPTARRRRAARAGPRCAPSPRRPAPRRPDCAAC